MYQVVTVPFFPIRKYAFCMKVLRYYGYLHRFNLIVEKFVSTGDKAGCI